MLAAEMADPGTIRGLTPAQIKDVLALPNLPSMITIVTVPAGTCVLVAQGAAVPGFGSGGTAQEYAAGTPSGAVAAALDHGPFPAPFTDMDLIYKSLDLLNFGDPAALRAALVQLDGEVYADFSSVAIGAGQLFLGAVRDRSRAATKVTGPVQQWLTAFGGALNLSGNGDSHEDLPPPAGPQPTVH